MVNAKNQEPFLHAATQNFIMSYLTELHQMGQDHDYHNGICGYGPGYWPNHMAS